MRRPGRTGASLKKKSRRPHAARKKSAQREFGLKKRIQDIKKRINAAARTSQRDDSDIRLLAAAKTMSVETVRTAIENGIDVIGENYIQEARQKYEALKETGVSWHFIGHLQSNKAKYAVRIFDLIHSVDSVKLAAQLDKEAGKTGKIQKILIQVNLDGEASKSGAPPEDALCMARQIAGFKHVSIRGLMTMPRFFDDPDRARPFFSALFRLKETLAAEQIPGVWMEELSMGMTGDFEAAIQEGATLVRVGTAIFGKRK